ncbi:sugar ABC transporter permease [Dactylosporangium sp. CA-092794]|uniref:sugar ABC transporter permease n=1 Tax=Dactylosporangium sp. CA-092794 TaxID=3239929 RepID=UPI003D8C8282
MSEQAVAPPVASPAARGPLPIVLGLVFAVPALILLLTSYVVPAIWTIRAGFQRRDGLSDPVDVGTQNYDRAINGEFWAAFGYALLIGLIPLLLVLTVAPALAWAAHRTGVTGRWVTRVVLSLPLALLTPTGLALAWAVYQQPLASDRGTARAVVAVAIAVTLFGAVIAAGATAYLAALRRRDPARSPWPALLVVAALAGLTTLALAVQTFTHPLLLTGGGPVHATQTPLLQIYDDGFRSFQFGPAAAASTVLLAVLAALGLAATILVIVTRLRLELDPTARSADAAPPASGTGPVALIVGGILLLAVLGGIISGNVPLLRGMFNGAATPEDLSAGKAFLDTYVPPLLSAGVGVAAAALAGFGIGALRPFGPRSELLLLPFGPFLFVGTGPLVIQGYTHLKDAGLVDTLAGLTSPSLIAIPALFAFTLLGRGQAARAEQLRQAGAPVPWARTYLLPALPMLALTFGATWLAQSQDVLWQLVAGMHDALTGPVLAIVAQSAYATNPDSIPFAAVLPPAIAALTLLAAVALQLWYLDRLALRVGAPEPDPEP